MAKRFSIFNSIPLLKPKRHMFNLSYENRYSTDLFRLTPFFCKEALPDDVWRLRAEHFCRVSPMIAPVMHRFDVRTYFFFVPNRIIWDNWEKFINPAYVPDPEDPSTEVVAPRLKINAYNCENVMPKSLADYLGVNVGLEPAFQRYDSGTNVFQEKFAQIFPPAPGEQVGGSFDVSSLPFRAYAQIYNDWFLDAVNSDPIQFSKGDDVDIPYDLQDPNDPSPYDNIMRMRYRSWEHDYFTSALPHPQRGNDVMAFDGAEIDLEGLGVVPADGDDNLITGSLYDGNMYVRPEYHGVTYNNFLELVKANKADFNVTPSMSDEDIMDYLGSLSVLNEFKNGYNMGQMTGVNVHQDNISIPARGTGFDPVVVGLKYSPVGRPGLTQKSVADGLSVTAEGSVQVPGVTVEELRIRMQMQSFLERTNVGGDRYTELLYAHWGVKDPDGRLQRAEFLGGSKQPVMINEVTQTSQGTDEDPLGTYGGQAKSAGSSKFIKYRVPEHGFIIGLMCIMPRTAYFQGLDKMFFRFDKLDYFWPSFAHLGEQEVLNKEVMNTGFDPEGVFGYQIRNADYKVSNDQIHGDLKGNLAHWTGARAFETPTSEEDIPKLSKEFVTPQSEAQDDIDRIFPVQNQGFSVDNSDHFILDTYNHAQASRRMPKFVTPRNGS